MPTRFQSRPTLPCTSLTNGSKDAGTPAGIARRAFLRTSAMGLGGAALWLASAERAEAKFRESGEVTLDGLMITYLGAPVGTSGRAVWSPKKTFETIFRLQSLSHPEIVFSPRVIERDENPRLGYKATQVESNLINGGLKVRHKKLLKSGWLEPAEVLTNDSTIFVALYKPRLQFDVASREIRFHLTGAEGGMYATAQSLREDDWGISAETVGSWLDQYVTDRTKLIDPRFKLKERTANSSSAVRHQINVTEAADAVVLPEKTVTLSARIIAQSGFQSDEIKQVFAVGNRLAIQHNSAQESGGANVMRLEADFHRMTTGVTEIYWDSVFKTFLFANVES